MSFQVTLQPSGLGFSATSDETILEAALAGGLLIPYSCRDGACGVCKSKVLAGEVDHGRYSESTLTVAEREAGMALLCCAHPRSDLIVEVRQVSRAGDIPVKKLPCRVQKRSLAADDVIILELKLPASAKGLTVGRYVLSGTPAREGTCLTAIAASLVRVFCVGTCWRLMPGRSRSVSTIAPIMATSSTRPAAWK